jgi:hypothetical protein
MGPKRARNTLSKPFGTVPVHWTRPMFAELDAAVLDDASVRETARRVGVDEHALARGAMLRLRWILLALHRGAA